MRRLAPLTLLALLVSVSMPERAHAAPRDAVTARDQLKQGYALKKEGRCADAVPHLVESERLDPQSKTLLNLAECEDSLGHLVDADAHLLEARDRARTEGRAELETIANQRLAIIDKRVPRLTVTLAPGAPPTTQVFRDEALLGAVSLGVALPVDPGAHVVVATAADIGNRRFEVTLRESESQTLTVSPVVGGAPSVAPPPTVAPDTAAADSGGVSHVPAIVAFGVGGAGVIVGSIFAARAFSKWSDAKTECTSVASTCAAGSPSAMSTSSARTSATVSDVGFIAGGVGVAAGVVLLILESRSSTSSASSSSLWIDPHVGTSGGSLSLGGRF